MQNAAEQTKKNALAAAMGYATKRMLDECTVDELMKISHENLYDAIAANSVSAVSEWARHGLFDAHALTEIFRSDDVDMIEIGLRDCRIRFGLSAPETLTLFMDASTGRVSAAHTFLQECRGKDADNASSLTTTPLRTIDRTTKDPDVRTDASLDPVIKSPPGDGLFSLPFYHCNS
eukprot:5556817-Pleurochrysis_carterae.AAC.3